MPAKGSHLTFGNRDHIIDLDFYKKYKATTGSEIDFKTFKDIIIQSNAKIAEIVYTEQDGFKMPENLGYLVVTRYNSNKKPIDYQKSKEYETTVIHNNLHSNRDIHALRWYNNRITNNIFAKIYKYKGNREFTRNVAKAIKAEVQFLHWTNADFFNYNQVSKLYKTINRKNGKY